MLRENFTRELGRLSTEIIAIFSLVHDNLGSVTNALVKRNMIVAQRLIDGDRQINERTIAVVLDALKLIATQQPMAGDMRRIAAMIQIAGELERINDYVKGIARTSVELGPEAELLPSFAFEIPRMTRLTQDMLSRAMTAFAENDGVLAKSIPPTDDMVDDIFNSLYADIIHFATEDGNRISRANKLEWVAHDLERSADRVINICEWISYMTTGTYVEFDSEHMPVPRGN